METGSLNPQYGLVSLNYESLSSNDRSPDDENDTYNMRQSQDEESSTRHAPAPPFVSSYYASYMPHLFYILVLLVLPWIMFGIIWGQGGWEVPSSIAHVVDGHGRSITALASLSGTLFSLFTGFCFSTAMARFSQNWLKRREEVDIFHILFFMALRYQLFPWGLKDFFTSRGHLLIVVAVLIITFHFISSGISGLLVPAPFNKTTTLTGTELDFSSGDPNCTTWLKNRPVIQGTCGWSNYHGFDYTTCLGETQIVDALESGRNNILSLHPDNDRSQVFNQLGGLHFLAPIRGVLPIGPDGVPGFDTLSPSRLSDPHAMTGVRSYQYTLDHQGLESDIKCSYDTESPVVFTKPHNVTGIYQVQGSCPSDQDFLGSPMYLSILSNHTLGFWACGSGQRAPDLSFQSYFLFLSGLRYYNSTIGNITCSFSSMRPSVFPVTFSKRSGAFTSSKPSTRSSTYFPSDLIRQSVQGLGSLVSEGQGFSANAMAESVITLGVKSLGRVPDHTNNTYLPLFEAMLQGIIEYQATYTRLIYTVTAHNESSPAPSSCMRTVNGTVTYEVTGWHYDKISIGFLLPATIINLLSLFLLLKAMFTGEKELYERDPTDLISYLLSPAERLQNGKVKMDLGSDPNTPMSEMTSFMRFSDQSHN